MNSLALQVQRMPEPSSVAATAGTDAYAAASTLAGVVMFVRMLANDLARDGIHVSAIHPGWGREAEGLPQRHTQIRVAAAVLRETLARLGEDQRSRLVDLYGGRLPETGGTRRSSLDKVFSKLDVVGADFRERHTGAASSRRG